MYWNFAQQCTDWRWEYNDKLKSNTSNVQFLGIIIDTLCCAKFTQIWLVLNFSKTYMAGRTKPYLSRDALKIICYPFYHSIMSYGLISGEMPTTHSDNIFKLKKWIITVIMGARISAVENYSKF